jgi:hypothetical protein
MTTRVTDTEVAGQRPHGTHHQSQNSALHRQAEANMALYGLPMISQNGLYYRESITLLALHSHWSPTMRRQSPGLAA